MHDVDDEDGDVAEGGPPVAQVREGLVARSVDDQQAGELDVVEPLDHLALLADDLDGDVGGADLLRDPPGLPVLHVRPTELVQDLKGINIESRLRLLSLVTGFKEFVFTI